MGQLCLSTSSSWLAAIGCDDSSHMRPHRTVQPPPPNTRLAALIAQPSFCKSLIASLTPRGCTVNVPFLQVHGCVREVGLFLEA
jgi:hypothetical protein